MVRRRPLLGTKKGILRDKGCPHAPKPSGGLTLIRAEGSPHPMFEDAAPPVLVHDVELVAVVHQAQRCSVVLQIDHDNVDSRGIPLRSSFHL